MIQANELRVGNKLKTNSGRVVSVTGLPLGNTHSEWHVECDFADYDFEDLSPIPLNHEKLENYGLKWDKNNDVFFVKGLSFEKAGQVIYLTHLDVKEGNSFPMGQAIQYLHQLQNLYFALTGEELKIEL